MIGIIALIFLGPRKLPQIARTIGKTMADFRNTTNEFKSTWEREVNFDEESKALRAGDLFDTPVVRITPLRDSEGDQSAVPEVKEIDKSVFNNAIAGQSTADELSDEISNTEHEDAAENTSERDALSDKRSWL